MAAAGVGPSEPPEHPAAGRMEAAPGKAAFKGWAWDEHWAQVTDVLWVSVSPLSLGSEMGPAARGGCEG